MARSSSAPFIQSCEPTEPPAPNTTDETSAFTASIRSDSFSYGLSARTTTAPKSAPAVARKRTSFSVHWPYLPVAMLSSEPEENATMAFGSSVRVVLNRLMATAPMPPGMKLTCIGVSNWPCRPVCATRQVKSKPPPGCAGAMHSGLVISAANAGVARPATMIAAAAVLKSFM